MPSGPGVISDELIHEIAAAVPSSIETFLLTSETEVDAIIAHHQKVNTTALQLVDAVDIDDYIKIKQALPQVKLVQVIHVVGQHSIEEAVQVSVHVDAILLDSGNPNLTIKVLGGTGNTHDWTLSRRIVKAVNIPVFLAGGLRADNVQEAMKAVRPYGLDLCSGVRTDGKLEREKLEQFFKKMHTAK